LGNEEEEDTDKENDDVESQKIVGKPMSFIPVGKNFSPLDIER